jgi:hypothetical protein
MFSGVASRSAVLSFSVGMQAATTVTTATLGGICIAVMLRRLPWRTGIPGGPQPGTASAEH